MREPLFFFESSSRVLPLERARFAWKKLIGRLSSYLEVLGDFEGGLGGRIEGHDEGRLERGAEEARELGAEPTRGSSRPQIRQDTNSRLTKSASRRGVPRESLRCKQEAVNLHFWP